MSGTNIKTINGNSLLGSGDITISGGGGGATQDADGDTKIQVEETTDDDTIRFDTAGSQRMVISNTGQVGIGTNSASAPLQVSRSDAGIIQYITNTSSAQAYTAYGNSDNPPYSQDFNTAGGLLIGIDSDETGIVWQGGNKALRFGTNGLEVARFQGTGALVIGKTTGTQNTAGTVISATDGVRATVDGNVASILNRTSSDGSIVSFRKDGTEVGSIGASSGSAYIQGNANSSGFLFGNSNIYPWDAGALADNSIDLGDSTTRFRNLHLSGDINVTGCSIPKFYNDSYLNSSTTTADLISELTNDYGAFNDNYVILKNAWSYAGNSNLVTGHSTIGTIELAGCVVEAWGGTYKHIRITRPMTGTGGATICVYNDQGSTYSPGWREIWNSSSDGASSGLDADLLDGYHGSTTRNSANTYPIRNSSGYLDLGWINTTSGATTSTVSRIYASQDAYLRYVTQATFRSQVISGQTINEIYNTGWYRTNGSGGWYNQTYGGGINMQDTTYVRTYGSKQFYVNNHIKSAANVYAYWSDDRLKTKIGNIDNALDKVQSLSGFTYTRNAVAKSHGFGGDEVEVGVSAQQVKAVLPEAIHLAPFDEKVEDDGTIVSKSGEDFMTVDYPRLVPLLIEAIKELKGQVDDLQTQIKELQ